MYTPEQIQNIKMMRKKFKPEEIALMVGKSKAAIETILSRAKHKDEKYPKLRPANLKHDKAKAEEWRSMVRAGLTYKEIYNIEGVHPPKICQTLAMEARGELGW